MNYIRFDSSINIFRISYTLYMDKYELYFYELNIPQTIKNNYRFIGIEIGNKRKWNYKITNEEILVR